MLSSLSLPMNGLCPVCKQPLEVVDFRLSEVRGALEDILRLGSANIPDLWLSDEEMVEKGLVES